MAPRIPRRNFRFRINLMLMKISWRTFAHSRSAKKSEFPLRAEPSRIFRFSTPNTLRIYVFTLRVVPSLPPRRYVQLTQIQSNLLEYMWSRETPLDAKIGGISQWNCFLDMEQNYSEKHARHTLLMICALLLDPFRRSARARGAVLMEKLIFHAKRKPFKLSR